MSYWFNKGNALLSSHRAAFWAGVIIFVAKLNFCSLQTEQEKEPCLHETSYNRLLKTYSSLLMRFSLTNNNGWSCYTCFQRYNRKIWTTWGMVNSNSLDFWIKIVWFRNGNLFICLFIVLGEVAWNIFMKFITADEPIKIQNLFSQQPKDNHILLSYFKRKHKHIWKCFVHECVENLKLSYNFHGDCY